MRSRSGVPTSDFLKLHLPGHHRAPFVAVDGKANDHHLQNWPVERETGRIVLALAAGNRRALR
jgi:hypothetical protein